ncbi:MAG: hypothetical protein KAI81_09375 [Candidatus Marinimicrobia bacterium]|nr:hypothetical protein [Candidatus Neomarinimicrobiota bacterium]
MIKKILLIFIIIVSCTPDTRYLLLNTFVDGVPEKDVYFAQKYTPAQPINDTLVSDISSIVIDTFETKAKPVLAQGSKHQPYSDKNCSACHNLQQGNALIMSKDDLCIHCHKDFENLKGWLHGPVAVKACDTCHEPHKSENKRLLSRPGDKLCTLCHDNFNSETDEIHNKTQDKSCLHCHLPHSSETSKFFVKTGEI